MAKKGIIAILIVLLMTIGFSCGSREVSVVDTPGYDDVVAYYGCPNSKKTKRLQTSKIKKLFK